MANFSVQADAVEIDPDRAVAVGVILAELVVNARKHAYPNGNGPVRVKLQADEPTQVKLSVEDDGVGLVNGAEVGRPRPRHGDHQIHGSEARR